MKLSMIRQAKKPEVPKQKELPKLITTNQTKK
jgi:hypothetical protein